MAQQFVLPSNRPDARARIQANAIRAIEQLPGDSAWRIDIKRERRQRGLKANAFMWAALYAPLVEKAGYTPDEWHTYFLGSYFGWREIDRPGGRVELVPKRTTTKNELGERDVLDGKRFGEFLEHVQAEAGQYGAYINIPTER